MSPCGVTSAPAPAPAAPVGPSERLAGLDVLRGLALIGVLFANLPVHYTGPLLAGPHYVDASDGPAVQLLGALFQGKFFVLFSLLFGIGLVVQFERSWARGENPWVRYRRRLTGLIVLGLLHGVLLFEGDILMAYGILGFLLPLFLRVPPGALVAWAAVLVTLGTVLMTALTAVPLALDGDTTPGLPADSWLQALGLRTLFMVAQVPMLLIAGLQVLGMFVLGVAVMRAGWLQNEAVLRRWRGPVLLTGLALAVPGGWFVFSGFLPGASAVAVGLGMLGIGLGGPLVALGVVGWVGVWLARSPGSTTAAVFGNVGRMSLTCYLGQSLLLQPLLSPLYLGLSEQVSLWGAMALAAVVYAALALFAWAWLRRFRFGPAEWLLRSWTYGARQPMRA